MECFSLCACIGPGAVCIEELDDFVWSQRPCFNFRNDRPDTLHNNLEKKRDMRYSKNSAQGRTSRYLFLLVLHVCTVRKSFLDVQLFVAVRLVPWLFVPRMFIIGVFKLLDFGCAFTLESLRG